jgi:hypothetical protein
MSYLRNSVNLLVEFEEFEESDERKLFEEFDHVAAENGSGQKVAFPVSADWGLDIRVIRW